MSPLEQKIAALTAEVNGKPTILESAEAYIAGVPGIVQQAISDAITAGAAPGVLGAFAVLVQALQMEADALTAALMANTLEDAKLKNPMIHGYYPDITPAPQPESDFIRAGLVPAISLADAVTFDPQPETEIVNERAGDYADMLTDIQTNQTASIAEADAAPVSVSCPDVTPTTEDMPF